MCVCLFPFLRLLLAANLRMVFNAKELYRPKIQACAMDGKDGAKIEICVKWGDRFSFCIVFEGFVKEILVNWPRPTKIIGDF